MHRGASGKPAREHRPFNQRPRQQPRQPDREDEAAARLANRPRPDTGEPADPATPLPGYRHLSVDQVLSRLDGLKQPEIRRIRSYEERHKKRGPLLEELNKRLAA